MEEITAISAIAYKAILDKTKPQGRAPLWTGSIDGDKLTVVKKKDHSLIVQLFRYQSGAKRGNMICMATVKSFGPEDEVIN